MNSFYANLVGNVVKLDKAERLRKDIEKNSMMKDSMADIGVLVYCCLGIYLASWMVAAHILNYTALTKRKKDVKG